MKRSLFCLNFIGLLGIFLALLSLIYTVSVADLTLQLTKLLAVEEPPMIVNILSKEFITMRSLMFNFRLSVSPERQEAILAQIETWDGISQTARLKPNTKHPEIRRMCYAYVSTNTDIEALIERLSALPEIESAFIPAERRLL